MNKIDKFKILIAEDAPIQGKKLQYVLEKFGYQVVWALDGLLALEELKKEEFSLVITDYQMPNLDGLELLKKIRSLPELNKIPVILLTTIEDEMVFLESLEAGANEFLNKPFRPEELKLRVKNLISLYHYQQVLDEDNRELTATVHEQNKLLKQHFSELSTAHEELKNMQEQLVLNSKLASLGVFSAGMAHEINNPLTIIKMHNLKLKKYLDRSHDDKEALIALTENIDKNADRINKIILHLKKFSQTENLNDENAVIEKLDLEKCLLGLKEFYEGLISKYAITLNVDYEKELFSKISPTLLEQIVINLIQNAVDAMENVDNRKMELSLKRDGEFAHIRVTDNGSGIGPEVKDKIFDPFFTTKEPGKGTGLGLSLVRSYLKLVDGRIEVNSEIGRTSFDIRLRLAV